MQHVGRLLLLSLPAPDSTDFEVLRVASEELSVMAVREKWHFQLQQRSLQQYHHAINSVTRTASFGGPATQGQF